MLGARSNAADAELEAISAGASKGSAQWRVDGDGDGKINLLAWRSTGSFDLHATV